MASDILDLSVLQSGCENIEFQNINMSKTFKNILIRFEAFSGHNGYIIELHINHAQYVLADKFRIEQVLYNLIVNAINYTGEDKTVSLTLSDMDGNVRFEVRDNGDGIPEEDLP